MNVSLFLLVLALVFLALEAISVPAPSRLKWGWAGLFLLAAVQLVGPLR